ncbi:hypothetical protein QL919_05175 [Psychrobacter sp. APC 3426]|uniref:hypothetical protein n=1 Tax=Psychrobacter sp. APC 3426 TaxID=3035177 RepID=UPI0025B32684|nr:hypothetical protein [Psychrobacter sp. APC 3426]MDN3398114.1 hypothetical protein [Psychrobacter sp. APC 3426]
MTAENKIPCQTIAWQGVFVLVTVFSALSFYFDDLFCFLIVESKMFYRGLYNQTGQPLNNIVSEK